jgi:DNA-binding transcriptional LysR family regulator
VEFLSPKLDNCSKQENTRRRQFIIAGIETMDRLESLAAFVEVAERASFAEAARRLQRSPPAVTRAVAELEARLGVQLLTRTTRAVAVTEAGQLFLAGAKRVLADLEDIEQAAAGRGHTPSVSCG